MSMCWLSIEVYYVLAIIVRKKSKIARLEEIEIFNYILLLRILRFIVSAALKEVGSRRIIYICVR